MAREDLHFRLRIPEDLKARIEASATLNKRSMTAEIIARLEQSFDGWPSIALPESLASMAQSLPQGAVSMLEMDLNDLARKLIRERINEHLLSRAAILDVFRETLKDQPEKEHEKLLAQLEQTLTRVGLGQLNQE